MYDFLSPTVYTNIYQVEEHSIDFRNPEWDPCVTKLLASIAVKLGICPTDLSANLEMLLYMEKGSSIDWCTYVEDDANVIGTMFIQLPSIFTGGRISVFDGDEDEEDNNDFVSTVDLGRHDGSAEFNFLSFSC